jgi:type I restriction enzyme M protein
VGQVWLTRRGKDAKKTWVGIEYESDPDLLDTEQVPLLEDVEAFMKREVLPNTPDAWIDPAATKIGYEISFTRHFYKPQPLRSSEEIRADILALDQETEGMLAEIIGGSPRLLQAADHTEVVLPHIMGKVA